MGFPVRAYTTTATFAASAAGTVATLPDLLPGGFTITNIRVGHPNLGANTNLAVRQEVLNALGTAFGSPSDIITASATTSQGVITGGFGSSNAAPRRISLITSGAGTATGTVTLVVEGFQNLV